MKQETLSPPETIEPETALPEPAYENPWSQQVKDHFFLETIQKMKPKSDEEHFVGNEYFTG